MNRFKHYIRQNNVQNIMSFSGGKDSTAQYLLYMMWGADFRPIFCDTGHEHEMTLEFVSKIHEKTGGPKVEWIKADFSKRFENRRKFIAVKWPHDQFTKDGRLKSKAVPQSRVDRALELMHPSGNPFLDLCMLKGRFPSTKARFCTAELKTFPMLFQVIFPALKNGPVISVQGTRAQESRARAKQPQYDIGDGGAIIYRPIHKWMHEDVFAIHKKFNIEPNPLYKLGMGRVGCMPCIMCNKGEMFEIQRRFPEHVARVAEWEKIVSDVSRRGISTFFADNKAPKPEGSEREIDGYYNIYDIAEWSKTSMGGRQFNLLNEIDAPICSSQYGLCE